MNRQTVLTATVAVLSLFAAQAIYAAPAPSPRASETVSKTKDVKLNLRNDSALPLELKVGDNLMTIDPKKTVSIKVPEGTRIIASKPTPSLEAGALLVEVQSYLDGTTIAIK